MAQATGPGELSSAPQVPGAAIAATGPGTDDRPGLAPLLVLLGATLVWGSTFVVTKDALATLDTWSLLFWRFAVSALVLVALAGRRIRRMRPLDVRRSVMIGLLLAAGFGAQTLGLTRTTAAANGFITGLMVVLAPIVAWLAFGRRFHAWTWVAVALASVGLYIMSWSGGGGSPLGVALSVLGAALFAGQIACVSQWSPGVDPLALTAVQVSTAWVVSALAAAANRSLLLPATASSWLAIGYLAVVATVIGLVAQVWAQARMSAARAAVIMTMEPVFAGAFAVLGGEAMTVRLALGGAIIVAAMLLVELTGSPAASAPAPDPAGTG